MAKRQRPVVFGDTAPTDKKGSTMKMSNSRYIKSEKNQWREVEIHESNLILAMEFALRQTTQLKPSETIDRVIVGEPVNGIYPLSVAIVKRKEVISN